MTVEPPDFSGRYEVIREIGRGGLGVVVLARHLALDRLVAIKRVAAGYSADRDARERLQSEARLLGRLHHEHIVSVFDFGYDGDYALIVMEYVDGQNLEERMATRAQPASFSLQVMADVAAALDHAHSRGIVHLDLKPSNVLIGPQGRAKVGDFGLARLLAVPSRGRRAEGLDDPPAVAGTPGYMPPEQIRGDTTDARSDAYAYAATAYRILTGVPVFENTDPADILDAHLHSTPSPPAQILAGFPEFASEALIGGLAKDPRERWSATEISAALCGIPAAMYPIPKTVAANPTAVAEPLRTEGAPEGEETIVLQHDTNSSQSYEPVVLPIYSPPVTRRHRWPLYAIVAVAVAVAVLTTAVAVRVHYRGSVAVDGVHLVVSPVVASCPRGTFTFTASLTTNGHGGPIEIQWLRPDGDHSPLEIVNLPGRSTHPRVQLKFTVDGTTATPISATLDILAPARLSATSPSAEYTC